MAAKYCYQKICMQSNCAKTTTRSVSIRGIIFDMDGTLTLPVLDFKGLRSKLGIDQTTDILQYASTQSPDKQKYTYKVIADWEAEGIAKMALRPSIYELFYFLKKENMNIALLTRNNRVGVDAFVKKF